MEVLGRRNRRVAEAAGLHDPDLRHATGRSLIEGPHLFAEALAAGVRPEVVFALPEDQSSSDAARRHGVELVHVDEAALSRIAGTRTPRGPVAVIAIPPTPAPSTSGLLVSWGVGDPGNIGTMIRTAAAFGWDFGYTQGSADPWSPKALRAGSGGQFHLGVRAIGSVPDVEAAGYIPVATVVAAGVPPDSLPDGRYGVLVGEEASGLPVEVIEMATHRVTIPMPGGAESMNAAVAAAVVVYELSKPGREPRGQV